MTRQDYLHMTSPSFKNMSNNNDEYKKMRKYIKTFTISIASLLNFFNELTSMSHFIPPENLWYSGVFRGYKEVTLGINGLGREIRFLISFLTHSKPLTFFNIPCKHQKTKRFSDVFRGY